MVLCSSSNCIYKNSITQFDWKGELGALANPNLQVKLLTDLLIHIFTNFIANDERVAGPSDPAWMTNNITHFYCNYKKSYKSFIKKWCPSVSSDNHESLRQHHTKLVTDAQEKYLVSQGMKLSSSGTSVQQIWAIINYFLRKAKSLNIPSILFNNIYITDIKEKANLLNDYFPQQCTLIDGGPFPVFVSKTNKSLSDVPFDESDIQVILKQLNPNKAHGWDNISIRMIQICGDSLVAPLLIVYKKTIAQFHFYQFLIRSWSV